MIGQWIGAFSGTNPGLGVINIERNDGFYRGQAYAWAANPLLPSSYVEFALPQFDVEYTVTVSPRPLTVRGNEITEEERRLPVYNNVAFPNEAKLTFVKQTEKVLSATWEADPGPILMSGLFTKFDENIKLINPVYCANWDEFKSRFLRNFVAETGRDIGNFVFRGQSNNAWKIRTSFHREGRFIIEHFRNNDLCILENELLNQLHREFNLNNETDLAAFCHLVQHHGYPTPLVDWTRSPYVAAYFAFEGAPIQQNEGMIRIFAFDSASWERDVPAFLRFGPAPLHISVLRPKPISNIRSTQQQALSMFTNIDDLERYIDLAEKNQKKKYLYAVDIPVSERRTALNDLNLMNINHGTLFPGIDGICRKLRNQLFR